MANRPKDMMQSEDDGGEGSGKRRRVQRACDSCRRKKIRCLIDGNGPCNNCSSLGLECTFVDAAKKRAPPRSYVDALEARMEKAEALLGQIAPGVDFTERLGPPVTVENSKGMKPSASHDATYPSPFHRSWNSGNGYDDDDGGEEGDEDGQGGVSGGSNGHSDEAEDVAFLVKCFRDTELKNGANTNATASPVDYHNSADSMSLIKGKQESNDRDSAQNQINGLTSGAANTAQEPRGEFWMLSSDGPQMIMPGGVASNGEFVHGGVIDEPVKYFGSASGLSLINLIERISRTLSEDAASELEAIQLARSEIVAQLDLAFIPEKPELPNAAQFDLRWPSEALEARLLDAYFENIHPSMPIMNEVIFRDQLKTKPALRKRSDWLCVALGVFSCAARFLIDDVEAIQQGGMRFNDMYEPGLQWWEVRKKLGASVVSGSPTMYHVQSQLLTVTYLNGTPLGTSLGWTILGAAIRTLQGFGGHRKITSKRLRASIVIEETFRRMFWVAYDWDRDMASGMGRPLMIQDEDFDLDEPLDVDDAVLVEADRKGVAPVQPDGQPSRFSAFISSLKLHQIFGRTLRTIYAIGKAKAMRGFVGWQWDQFIVSELDSALNQWLNTVPPHLHFNPKEPDDATFLASARLYMEYYVAQIFVHRPFVPSLKATSPLNFPSLAICTNAARSSCHIIDAITKRKLAHRTDSRMLARSSAVAGILLIMVWSSRSSASVMSEVRKCVEWMGLFKRSHSLGMVIYEVFNRLADMSERFVPNDAKTKTSSKKRQFHDEEGVRPMNNSSADAKQTSALSGDSAQTPVSATDSEISSEQSLRGLPLSTQEIAHAFEVPSQPAGTVVQPGTASTSFIDPFSEGGSTSAQEVPAGNPSTMPTLEFESRRRLSAFAIDPTKSPSMAMSAFFGGGYPGGFPSRSPYAGTSDLGLNGTSFPFTPGQFQAQPGGPEHGMGTFDQANTPTFMDPLVLPAQGQSDGSNSDPFAGMFGQGHLWNDFTSGNLNFFQQ